MEQHFNISSHSCIEYRQTDMKLELNANFTSAFRQFYRQILSRRNLSCSKLRVKNAYRFMRQTVFVACQEHKAFPCQTGKNKTSANGTRQLSFVLLIKYAHIDILDT